MDLEALKEEWKANKLQCYETKLEQKAELQATRMLIANYQEERRVLMNQIRELKKTLPEVVRRPRRGVAEENFDKENA